MEFRRNSKLTSHFVVIAQMWLALFFGSLQMVLEPLSNARSCCIRTQHDVALTTMSEV
jgi:hypothetical protein